MTNQKFEPKTLANRTPQIYAVRTIMIVDDERVIADTLTAILQSSGYSVSTAYGAESALAELSVATPDLMITDVCMPGMNGIELAIEVCRKYPQCRVLLLSGHASSTSLLAEARARGFNFQLLSKPIHPRDLIAQVEQLKTDADSSCQLSEAV